MHPQEDETIQRLISYRWHRLSACGMVRCPHGVVPDPPLLLGPIRGAARQVPAKAPPSGVKEWHGKNFSIFISMEPSGDEVLSRTSYWDERYSHSDGSSPTHEWFQSFAVLEPFFASHLFDVPGLTPRDRPLIMHLGSGDSVRLGWQFPSSC